jgi:hypothetical protein
MTSTPFSQRARQFHDELVRLWREHHAADAPTDARGAGGETFAELAEYFHCSPRTAWQAFHGHGAYRDVA